MGGEPLWGESLLYGSSVEDLERVVVFGGQLSDSGLDRLAGLFSL